MRMRRPAVALAVIALLGGCDSGSPTAPDASTTAKRLTITGDTQFTGLNDVHAFAATVEMADGSQRDVTADAVWQSSNARVLATSATGVATSIGFGVATVTASYQAIGGSLGVSVSLGPGRYRLGIIAATTCTSLPSWARHSEYNASLDETGSRRLGIELSPGHTTNFPTTVSTTHLSFEFPVVRRDDYGDFVGPNFLASSQDGIWQSQEWPAPP
jgi:hypothetical protein